MKKLLSLLSLLPSLAFGQFAGTDNVTISSVSAGDEVTRWVDYFDDNDAPTSENYLYADGTSQNFWESGSIPEGFEGIWLVHTNSSDASTTDASLVTFTTSGRAQVCVLWPEATSDPGWLATGSYLDNGRSVSAGGNTYDMYCAMKDGGALAFGDSDSTMYMVTVAPAWRAQPAVNTPSPDENGFYVFATPAYELDEDATTGGGASDPKLRRILGSDGAVTVDVDDAASTTCSTSDFNFAEYPTTPSATTPVTFSWGDGGLGNKFLNISVADVSADCIIVLEFENATGGISAYTDRQTATITVRDGTPVSAGNLFVEIGGSGDDANDCTSGTPCLTIQRAQGLATPGDIIEVQVSGTGTGTYTSCTNFTKSGEENNEIVLRVRSGDTVNFIPTSCGTSDGAVWEFASGTDYIQLDGSVGTMVCGDPADFDPVNDASTFSHKMCFSGVADNSYIEINNITMYGGSRDEGKCNRVRGNTSGPWHIHNNTFDYCGTNFDATKSSNQDVGDTLSISAPNILVENNTFGHGGHNNLYVAHNQAVIRGNTFDGDWTDTATGKDGQRCWEYAAGNDGAGAVSPYGPGLFERNVCINADAAEKPNGNTAKWNGWALIARQNLLCENEGLGMNLTINANYTDADGGQVESARIYNNTWINNDAWFRLVGTGNTYANLSDMRFINNLGDNFQGYDGGSATDNLTLLAFASTGPVADQGYANDWLGAVFRNNWIHSAQYLIKMKQRGIAAVTWPTNVETEWSANFEGNATTRATYSAYAGAGDCNFTDLAISGDGEDDAEYLTTVTQATSGTTLNVEDGYFFYDGFGLSYYGESGDYIAVYDSTGHTGTLRGIVQITDVVSQTQLTLSGSLTVSVGDTVYFVESDGTTVVDNMGAVQ